VKAYSQYLILDFRFPLLRRGGWRAHLDTATGAPTSGPARPRRRPINAGSETGAPLRFFPLAAVSRCARWNRFWLLILVVMFGSAPAALAATFTASLDRSTISARESATMSLRFEGGLPAEIPAVPNVPGLSIASNGQSSQFNFVNGQA